MRNETSQVGHAHAEKDEVNDNEAEARDEPLEQESAERETPWLAQTAQEGAENQENYVRRGETRVVSVPLVLDLLRALRVQVELLG